MAQRHDQEQGARERAPEELERHGGDDVGREGAAERRARRVHRQVAEEPRARLGRREERRREDGVVQRQQLVPVDDQQREEVGEEAREARDSHELEGQEPEVHRRQEPVGVLEGDRPLEPQEHGRPGVADLERDVLEPGRRDLVVEPDLPARDGVDGERPARARLDARGQLARAQVHAAELELARRREGEHRDVRAAVGIRQLALEVDEDVRRAARHRERAVVRAVLVELAEAELLLAVGVRDVPLVRRGGAQPRGGDEPAQHGGSRARKRYARR